ncbi:hypothetical protein ACMD2_02354 [Ananas comosus]|uniref:Uncharacterized protein n=1 Tax=Ananas comosus TaxID=4615 RepID=A0A199VC19_ANACO|nr:hypothetical protein ACMD2_02354 [Ananas comosus]
MWNEVLGRGLRLNGSVDWRPGSLTARGERIVKERLIEALDLIEKEFGGLHLVENGNGKLVENNEISCSDVNVAGNDPPPARKKGSNNNKKKTKALPPTTPQMPQILLNQMLQSSSDQLSQTGSIQMPHQPGLSEIEVF